VKKIIVLTWLLICLLPLTVKAEEPVKAPAGEGLVLALSPQRERTWVNFKPSLQELREGKYGRHSELCNEEMDAIFAKGMVVSYGGSFKFHHDGRIILWDEPAKSEGRGHLTNRVSIKE
jgi:hypothetical protein